MDEMAILNEEGTGISSLELGKATALKFLG